MKYVIVSDLHGNLEAFKSFREYLKSEIDIAGIIILGDVIDYGPHSNEVIEGLLDLPYKILCNIRGNHEIIALSGEGFSRLSTDRGRAVSLYTKKNLSDKGWDFIENKMIDSGKLEFNLAGYKCLAIHGSMEDEYWGKLSHESELSEYKEYDYVFSGHSHIPHFFEHFYEAVDTTYRNKKKAVFINPGSLGQPRNHNPKAQFAMLDLPEGAVEFIKVDYNVEKEQSDFSDEVDEFYRKRLEVGI